MSRPSQSKYKQERLNDDILVDVWRKRPTLLLLLFLLTPYDESWCPAVTEIYVFVQKNTQSLRTAFQNKVFGIVLSMQVLITRAFTR